MIQTLVFDFGNVISFFDHRLATARLARCTDIPEDELHSYLFGSTLDDEYERGFLTSAEFTERVLRECRLRCSPAEFEAAYNDIFTPNHEVCAFIPRLAERYRLLLLSNTNALHAGFFAPMFEDTFRHFAACVYSHDVGDRKPGRAIYARAQSLANCEPHECLFTDDILANVEGARRFGWNAVVFKNVRDFQERLREHGVAGELLRA